MHPSQITWLMETIDLMPMHVILTLFGVFVCLYAMQVTSHFQEDRRDPRWIREISRLSILALALSMLWQFTYSFDKGWQPWPPVLATNAIIDILMLVRAITVALLVRREKERQAFFQNIRSHAR